MSWRPLLEDELARRVEDALQRIVEGLPELDRTEREAGGERRLIARGLGGGAAGQSLFWAYLALDRNDEAAAERAEECLDRAAEELASVAMGPGLYGGVAGVGWVSEHLEGRLFEVDEDGEDANLEVDDALLAHLEHRPWRADYDLVSGLVGFGVYATERLPRPTARECLERVVEHLGELAVERPGGIAWHTPPELLPPHQRRDFPDGYLNLGVAHGVPGVIPILAAACRAGVAAERARTLLDGAVAWLLTQRLDGGFPYHAGEGEEHPARLAWCYGDPGVAVALLAAARAVGEAGWRSAAVEIARGAARRDPETAGVQDAGLCHGAAGLGHLFNRIHQATGDGPCGEAARFWYRRALEMEPPGEWVTGFPSLQPQPDGSRQVVEETGFLTGVAGVGLAFLAALSSREPSWDRVLLAELPPA
jgi:lantibiotic modifying enzyme